MSFSSVSFLIFFAAVFLIYWIAPHRYRWVALLAANVIFYASFEARFLLLLLLLAVVSYSCALLMERGSLRKKRLVLIMGVLFVLAFLVVYKYTGFALDMISSLASKVAIPMTSVTVRLLQPVGISYFTFQMIGYLVDVYRGRCAPIRHFGKYAVFVSFFVNITSGPIERALRFLPQLSEEKTFDYESVVYGSTLLLVGLLKKIVIADTVAKYADAVYGKPTMHDGYCFLVATVLFAVQIYCDFSGYSDMAAGLGKMLGIELTQNFRYPYFSCSIKEFWSRWHISLSGWFRDYVYIPLGGNRCAKWRRDLNLLLTFLVSGLWHGANLTYVFWGALHGTAQVIEARAGEAARKRQETKGEIAANRKTGFAFFLKWLLTMFTVCFAWIFFRADTLTDAFYIVTHMFHYQPFSQMLASLALNRRTAAVVAFLLLLLTSYDLFGRKEDPILRLRTLKWQFRWLIYLVGATLVIVLKIHHGADASFIYYNF